MALPVFACSKTTASRGVADTRSRACLITSSGHGSRKKQTFPSCCSQIVLLAANALLELQIEHRPPHRSTLRVTRSQH